MIMDIWYTYSIIWPYKMLVRETCKESKDTIETFDFSELKISSNEIKEYDTGKPYPSYKPSTIKKRREFSLEYKGGKPTFRADGSLYHLIYPHIFPEEEEYSICSFMVKLKERLNFLFKDIMDEYDKINKTVYGTGIECNCEVDRIEEYDLSLPFKGGCEFEIDKVTCWLNEKYSNLFKVELIAKDVKVRNVVYVKSKHEESSPLVDKDEFDENFEYIKSAQMKFRDFKSGEREFDVVGCLTCIYPDSCKGDDENLLIKEKVRNELVRSVLPLLDEYGGKLISKRVITYQLISVVRLEGFNISIIVIKTRKVFSHI